MTTVDELQKLHDLRQSGAISEHEYEKMKSKIVHGGRTISERTSTVVEKTDEGTLAMLLHLSQFLGFLIPGVGFIAPIIMWQICKDRSEVMDQHGRNVTNWVISSLIYTMISVALMIVLVGFFLLWLIILLDIIFVIVGAVKAANGKLWKYPGSIRFF